MIISCNDLPRVNPTGRGKHPRELLLKCDECQDEYRRPYSINFSRAERHFCTHECAYAHRKVTMYTERTCPQCDKVERVTRCEARDRKYCSQECYGKWRSEHADELGIRDVFNKPEVRARATKTIRESYKNGRAGNMLGKHHTDETKQKISEHHLLTGCLVGVRNGMCGRCHSEKSKEQMSDKHTQLFAAGIRRAYGKNGHVKGEFTSSKCTRPAFFRSSWERSFLEHLEKDAHVSKFTHEPMRIPYSFDNHKRWYVPDVLVEYLDGVKILYEIKPAQFVNSKRCLLKSEAARVYCQSHAIDDYQILTRTELEEMGAL